MAAERGRHRWTRRSRLPRRLDGFYTFAVGTPDGFAVLRDPFACKPAVMAETDDWVAMASEYRAIAQLPGAEDAASGSRRRRTVYIWEREACLMATGPTVAGEDVDLAVTPLRELNPRLHALARQAI